MENIFSQFHGADLERLTDCIAAVRKNGLSIDQHTHAGLNENSEHLEGEGAYVGDSINGIVYRQF